MLCVSIIVQLEVSIGQTHNCFPLGKHKGDVCYSKSTLDHNTLGKIVPDLMRQAGFEGNYSNHSLRVSLATCLYDAQVDEQLITSRIGHSSTDAYRNPKKLIGGLQTNSNS